MTIHEYGKDNQKIIVLIHPSVVMWDYFEYITPLLEGKFHLIIPALPGYDEKNHNQKCDLRRWYNALSASVDCYKANCGQRFSHDIHGENRRTWTS